MSELTEPPDNAVTLRPGEYVLTEHKGKFYAVGVVFVGPPAADVHRQARCCEDGHDSDDDADECWRAEIRLNGTMRGQRRAEVTGSDGD